MTKYEIERCEKLCLEAITSAKEATDLFNENDKINHDCSIATHLLRLADSKLGYAQGINQVLANLGYKSSKMKELSKLI